MVNHEVTEEQEIRTERGGDHGALIHAHDLRVLNDAAVGVELHSLFQDQGVVATFCIGKLHSVTVLKWTGIRHVRISFSAERLGSSSFNQPSMP